MSEGLAQRVAGLEGVFGGPSESGFGSAIFDASLDAGADLAEYAFGVYKRFLGDLWHRFGAEAWTSPWKEVYRRDAAATADIVAELRGIADGDASRSVPLVLDLTSTPEAGQAALSSVYDDPGVTELRVFTIGDGNAMSGLLVTGRHASVGRATSLVVLMD